MAHWSRFVVLIETLTTNGPLMIGKKNYAMNNTVVVDHNGLFIYIYHGYPGSFHDVSCLRTSSLDRN